MAEERKCSSTTCSKDSCKGCDKAQVDFSVKPNELTHVKKVIGVVSGKGGVGKSLVTSLLAVTMNKRRASVRDPGCGYYRTFYSKGFWDQG